MNLSNEMEKLYNDINYINECKNYVLNNSQEEDNLIISKINDFNQEKYTLESLNKEFYKYLNEEEFIKIKVLKENLSELINFMKFNQNTYSMYETCFQLLKEINSNDNIFQKLYEDKVILTNNLNTLDIYEKEIIENFYEAITKLKTNFSNFETKDIIKDKIERIKNLRENIKNLDSKLICLNSEKNDLMNKFKEEEKLINENIKILKFDYEIEINKFYN